jgi:hypothetical protein
METAKNASQGIKFLFTSMRLFDEYTK